MDSFVTQRPNHYELLGLTPEATHEEISRAFAREIGPLRPRPFGSIAQLSVAHETLRDPAKRRAYDDSLGLAPKPAPVRPLQGWSYDGPVRVSRPGAEPPPKHPDPAPFIAEAPAAPPTAEPHVEVERTQQPEARSRPSPAPRRSAFHDRPVPLQMRILPMEEAPAQWKRPALVAGGIFVAVGLIGAAAGLWASRDIQPQAVADAPALTLPSEAHAAVPPPADVDVTTRPQQRTAPRPPRPRVVKRTPQARPAATPPPVQAASPAPQDQRAEDVPEIPTEQVAALASQADSAAATMPLPDAVIARTIGRIGYSCGEVASTTAVDGASGVFKVTCSSGQSYKATPVHGRYHFRRWGG